MLARGVALAFASLLGADAAAAQTVAAEARPCNAHLAGQRQVTTTDGKRSRW